MIDQTLRHEVVQITGALLALAVADGLRSFGREGNKPKPRLQHIRPGQSFTLLRSNQKHLLLSKDDLYGYVKDGRIGLSAELNPETMVFGNGNGWRLRSNQ